MFFNSDNNNSSAVDYGDDVVNNLVNLLTLELLR